MIVLSIGVFFRGFNPARFILYLCCLIFTVLFALRLDNDISISYFIVFSPLFVCNLIAFCGAIAGIVSFAMHRPQSSDIALRLDFISMIFTTLQHAVLCLFEYFAAYKLDSSAGSAGSFLHWVTVFSPIFLECCVAVFVSIWAVRHDRSFEFELFFSINVVQFVFIAFKLDRYVEWSWAVVFIPLWVVLSLSVVGVLYALILALLLTRSRHLLPANRRNHIYGAIVQTLLVVPALVSLVLLTGKLDGASWGSSHPTHMTFTGSLLPLVASLLALLLMSFCSSGGNVWWFGLRRPFCAFLLDSFPMLKQYANVSYRVGVNPPEDADESPPPLMEDECRPSRPVLPLSTFDIPD